MHSWAGSGRVKPTTGSEGTDGPPRVVLADAYVDKVLLRAAPATVSGYKKRPRADPHRNAEEEDFASPLKGNSTKKQNGIYMNPSAKANHRKQASTFEADLEADLKAHDEAHLKANRGGVCSPHSASVVA